jgi:hypothetical protein
MLEITIGSTAITTRLAEGALRQHYYLGGDPAERADQHAERYRAPFDQH